MKKKTETNPFFQAMNIHNTIAVRLFEEIFEDCSVPQQIVVVEYVRNMYLYNHFLNTGELGDDVDG